MSSVDTKKYSSKLSSSESGVAGSVAGFITRGFVQPLDVLKIRFQLQVESLRKNKGGLYHGMFQAVKTIYKQEGITSIWRGHMSAQGLTVAYGYAQFSTLTFIKKTAHNLGYDEKGLVTSIGGGAAGFMGTLVSMPFDVARTRIVAQSHKEFSGTLDVWRKILRNENVFGLWKGLTPTLLMTVPAASIQFTVYEFLMDLSSRMSEKEVKIMGIKLTQSFVCGGIAGLVAKAVTYPLDVLKKRRQIKGCESVRERFGKVVIYRNLWDCVCKVTTEEGVLAWYKGLKPTLIKAGTFSSIIFPFYELSSYVILRLKPRDE